MKLARVLVYKKADVECKDLPINIIYLPNISDAQGLSTSMNNGGNNTRYDVGEYDKSTICRLLTQLHSI